MRSNSVLWAQFVLLGLFFSGTSSARADNNKCVIDVKREFQRLTRRGKYFRVRTTKNFPKGTTRPSYNFFSKEWMKHIQGFARIRSSNTIVMSGNAKGGSYLYSAKMASQPMDGRWYSNVKCKRKWYSFYKKTCKSPNKDTIYKITRLSRKFHHPGGIQSTGDIVVVGVDTFQGKPSEVRFYDYANPRSPRELRHVRIIRTDRRAESVAITRLRGPSFYGRYFLLVSTNNATHYTFYISTGYDMRDPHFRFIEYSSWRSKDHFKMPNYQALNFLTQCNGDLFLVGTYKSTPFFGLPWGGKDWVHVYRFNVLPRSPRFDSKTGFPIPKITKFYKKHMKLKKSFFTAGAGIYVDERDQSLRLYSTDYWPLNPFRRSTVLRFEEFTSQ